MLASVSMCFPLRIWGCFWLFGGVPWRRWLVFGWGVRVASVSGAACASLRAPMCAGGGAVWSVGRAGFGSGFGVCAGLGILYLSEQRLSPTVASFLFRRLIYTMAPRLGPQRLYSLRCSLHGFPSRCTVLSAAPSLSSFSLNIEIRPFYVCSESCDIQENQT